MPRCLTKRTVSGSASWPPPREIAARGPPGEGVLAIRVFFLAEPAAPLWLAADRDSPWPPSNCGLSGSELGAGAAQHAIAIVAEARSRDLVRAAGDTHESGDSDLS